MDCYCDYEMPAVYNVTQPQARKTHKCNECGHAIESGERYEYVFGVWDGDANTWKTCPRCKALRDFVLSHVPCCCWAHGSMRTDCIETAREFAHEAPGLLFGAYRRYVKTRTPKRAA